MTDTPIVAVVVLQQPPLDVVRFSDVDVASGSVNGVDARSGGGVQLDRILRPLEAGLVGADRHSVPKYSAVR